MRGISLYWYGTEPNFGDSFSVDAVSRLFDCRVEAGTKWSADLVAEGSVLDFALLREAPVGRIPSAILRTRAWANRTVRRPLAVWGSGILFPLGRDRRQVPIREPRFFALRGRKTFDEMAALGLIDRRADLAFGDPGLFMSDLIDGRPEVMFRRGFVAHAHHWASGEARRFHEEHPEIKLIDPRRSPEEVMADIAQCAEIFSSSLHGLVAADVLGIPNRWVALETEHADIRMNMFKFQDYYSAFGVRRTPCGMRDVPTLKPDDPVDGDLILRQRRELEQSAAAARGFLFQQDPQERPAVRTEPRRVSAATPCAPKASVLVPIYRTQEAYLRAAIESILNQTFLDFELVLLDDCPDDSREDVVRSYDDPRIVYLKNDRNLGITPSRNRLIDLAKGEYLAIFDHDDISLPTRLERQVAYLDAHPEVGVVSCWPGAIGSRRVVRNPEYDEDIRVSLMWDCAVTHSAAMIRKSVLTGSGVRYESYFSPAEDYGLWCRLLPLTKFHNIPEVLFKYRNHSGNTSSTQADRMLAGSYRVRALNRTLNARLWAEYELRAVRTWRIRLFGFVPVLRIRQYDRRTTVWLFGIPVLRVRSWCRMWR